jgi:hypothetical protein
MNVYFSTNYMFNGRKASKIFSKNGWRKPEEGEEEEEEEEERGFTGQQQLALIGGRR